MNELKTVADYIRKLREFPEDWPVSVSTQAGGGIAIEHRDVKGKSVVAVFGRNGGQFGENPMTEQEYQTKSREFLTRWKDNNYSYTTIHGDHRLFIRGSDTCYGQRYDRRIVERMAEEGLIEVNECDIDRVRRLD